MTRRFQGEYARARALGEEAALLGREMGNRWFLGYALLSLGRAVLLEGDPQRAMETLEEALRLLRKTGDTEGAGWALVFRGEVALTLTDYPKALATLLESLTLFQSLNHRQGIGVCLRFLATAARAQGEYAQAAVQISHFLALWRETGTRSELLCCLQALASLLTEQEGGEYRAARLLGATEALRERFGTPLDFDARQEYERDVSLVRAVLGETAYAAVRSEGQAMTLEQVIAYALEDTNP
jgi:ATP/maltotriose-dependent transcriptional regulator MalT